MDRVLIGHNHNNPSSTDNTGFWVSKPNINVTAFAGNSYFYGNIYGWNEQFEWTNDSKYTYGFMGSGDTGPSQLYTQTRISATKDATILINSNTAFELNDDGFQANEFNVIKTLNAVPYFTNGVFPSNGFDESFIGEDYPLIEMRVRRPKKSDGNDWTTLEIVPNADAGGPTGSWGSDFLIVWRSQNSMNWGTGGSQGNIMMPTDGVDTYHGWNSALGEYGDWATLEYDIENEVMRANTGGTIKTFGLRFSGDGGVHKSNWMADTNIDFLRFDFTKSDVDKDAQFVNDPDLEIDYIRAKKRGIPMNFGDTANDSLLFDSDWFRTGLIHQTGIVAIGNEYAWANGTSKTSGTSHKGSTSGHVEFADLPFIPVVLFQRIDDQSSPTIKTAFPGGDKEFSHSICSIDVPTRVWNDTFEAWEDVANTNFGAEFRTFAYCRAGNTGFDLTCRNAIARDGYEWMFNYTPQAPYIELEAGGNYDPATESQDGIKLMRTWAPTYEDDDGGRIRDGLDDIEDWYNLHDGYHPTINPDFSATGVWYYGNYKGTDQGKVLPTFDWANKFGDWNIPQFNSFYQYKNEDTGTYKNFKDAIGTSWTEDNTKFVDDSMWLGNHYKPDSTWSNNAMEYRGDIWHPQAPTKTFSERGGLLGFSGWTIDGVRGIAGPAGRDSIIEDDFIYGDSVADATKGDFNATEGVGSYPIVANGHPGALQDTSSGFGILHGTGNHWIGEAPDGDPDGPTEEDFPPTGAETDPAWQGDHQHAYQYLGGPNTPNRFKYWEHILGANDPRLPGFPHRAGAPIIDYTFGGSAGDAPPDGDPSLWGTGTQEKAMPFAVCRPHPELYRASYKGLTNFRDGIGTVKSQIHIKYSSLIESPNLPGEGGWRFYESQVPPFGQGSGHEIKEWDPDTQVWTLDDTFGYFPQIDHLSSIFSGDPPTDTGYEADRRIHLGPGKMAAYDKPNTELESIYDYTTHYSSYDNIDGNPRVGMYATLPTWGNPENTKSEEYTITRSYTLPGATYAYDISNFSGPAHYDVWIQNEEMNDYIERDVKIYRTTQSFKRDEAHLPANLDLPQHTKVAAGGYLFHALRTDTSFITWGIAPGDNQYGQISNAPTGTGYTAIAIGAGHSMVLKTDGSIVAWGRDDIGQVSGAPTGTGHIAIACSNYGGFALTAAGSIVAWGADNDGQVSDAPDDSGYTAIAAGGDFILALREDTSIDAWGNDFSGEPVSTAPADSGYIAIDAASHQGLALKEGGIIVNWGTTPDSYGDGVDDTAPTDSGYTAIAAGDLFALALTADGTIVSWGGRFINNAETVAEPPSGTGFKDIAADGRHAVALTADGSIVTWGTSFTANPPIGIGSERTNNDPPLSAVEIDAQRSDKTMINHFRQSYEYNLPGKSPHRDGTLRPFGYGPYPTSLDEDGDYGDGSGQYIGRKYSQQEDGSFERIDYVPKYPASAMYVRPRHGKAGFGSGHAFAMQRHGPDLKITSPRNAGEVLVGGITSCATYWSVDGATHIPPGLSTSGSTLTINLYPMVAASCTHLYDSELGDSEPARNMRRGVAIVPMKCIGSGETNMYSRHQYAIDQYGVQGSSKHYKKTTGTEYRKGWQMGLGATVTDFPNWYYLQGNIFPGMCKADNSLTHYGTADLSTWGEASDHPAHPTNGKFPLKEVPRRFWSGTYMADEFRYKPENGNIWAQEIQYKPQVGGVECMQPFSGYTKDIPEFQPVTGDGRYFGGVGGCNGRSPGFGDMLGPSLAVEPSVWDLKWNSITHPFGITPNPSSSVTANSIFYGRDTCNNQTSYIGGAPNKRNLLNRDDVSWENGTREPVNYNPQSVTDGNRGTTNAYYDWCVGAPKIECNEWDRKLKVKDLANHKVKGRTEYHYQYEYDDALISVPQYRYWVLRIPADVGSPDFG